MSGSECRSYFCILLGQDQEAGSSPRILQDAEAAQFPGRAQRERGPVPSFSAHLCVATRTAVESQAAELVGMQVWLGGLKPSISRRGKQYLA